MDSGDLYIFVEGLDDERFIEKAVVPRLKATYGNIRMIKYAGLNPEKRADWLKTIMKGLKADYLILADINSCPCVSKRKGIIRKQFKSRIDDKRIVIVIREIESWYLAGLDERQCKTFKMKYVPNTESVSKEDLIRFTPDKYKSNEFKGVIMKYFSMDLAITRNKSLKYFYHHYIDKMEA